MNSQFKKADVSCIMGNQLPIFLTKSTSCGKQVCIIVFLCVISFCVVRCGNSYKIDLSVYGPLLTNVEKKTQNTMRADFTFIFILTNRDVLDLDLKKITLDIEILRMSPVESYEVSFSSERGGSIPPGKILRVGFKRSVAFDEAMLAQVISAVKIRGSVRVGKPDGIFSDMFKSFYHKRVPHIDIENLDLGTLGIVREEDVGLLEKYRKATDEMRRLYKEMRSIMVKGGYESVDVPQDISEIDIWL